MSLRAVALLLLAACGGPPKQPQTAPVTETPPVNTEEDRKKPLTPVEVRPAEPAPADPAPQR